MGIAMIKLSYPKEEIIQNFMDGFRAIPNRAECLFHLAQYYFENNQMLDAYNIITIASNIKFPQQYLLFLNKDIYDYRIKQLRYFIMFFLYINNITTIKITKAVVCMWLLPTLRSCACTSTILSTLKNFISSLFPPKDSNYCGFALAKTAYSKTFR